MTGFRRLPILMSLVLLPAVLWAQTPRIASIRAENMPAPAGARVVEDQECSGGKALEIAGEGKKPGSDLITLDLPQVDRPGMYSLRLRLKTSEMRDLGKGWRVDVLSGKEVIGWGVAHGYLFKNGPGYQDMEVRFAIDKADVFPTIAMFWGGLDQNSSDDSKTVVRLDSLQVSRVGDLPVLHVTRVWPDKLRYRTDQKGTAAIAVRNTTERPVQGELRVELLHDLNPPQLLREEMVKLAAGGTREIIVPLKPWQGRFGYEVRAIVLVGGKAVDSNREYFCVSDNPFEVATHANRFTDCEFDRPDWRMSSVSAEEITGLMMNGQWAERKKHVVWGIRSWLDLDPTDQDVADYAMQARQAYTTMWEFYSWAPGGCVDLNPQVDIWPCGDDSRWLYRKEPLIRQVAALKKQGIGAVTYNIPYGQGLEAIDFLRERPEWFCTSADTHDFSGYNQADIKKIRDFRKRLEAAPKSQWPQFQAEARTMPGLPYLSPNFARKDVLEYVADRMIDSIRTFDWDGVRWDCGHLNTGTPTGVWSPFLDFYGKPLCKSPEEMVAQTNANLHYFRERIRQVRPYFCFGTNWGGNSPIQYPKMTEELMRDGGWLLDEETRRWSWADSPYRYWKKYYEYLSDRGELMTSLGGHYNPYGILPVKPRSFPTIALYEMIFGLAGHGHPEIYFRDKVFPIGDPAQFAVRFGRYLFDPRFRRADKPEQFLQVTSSTPLWWEKSLLRKVEGKNETWVLHLINPPLEEMIEDNMTDALPSPVKGVSVSLKVGTSKVRAWALTSESWQSGDQPRTQAVALTVKQANGTATATVPEVLFWKMVVFQVERGGGTK